MELDGARYERNPDYVYRMVVGEAILIPVRGQVADMECIYTLNDVGALLWQKLDKPATEADLHKAILEEYDADPQTVTADLRQFLRGMVAVGAVRRIPA